VGGLDPGAARGGTNQAGAVGAGGVGAGALLAVAGPAHRPAVQVKQRGHARVHLEDDIPAPAAIAAIRAAERLELLPVHGRAAVTAVARLHRDGDVVGELGHFLIASWVALAATCREGGPACGPPSTYALLCAVADPSPPAYRSPPPRPRSRPCGRAPGRT